MLAKLPSRRKRTAAHSMSRSVTPDLAFLLPIRPSCFRSFSRPTMPSPARKAAPAWVSPYQSASLRCTAAKSGSSHRSGKVRLCIQATGRGRTTSGAGRMTKRILVVEDQPDNRQIIRDMLAPTDYEITEAEDGQQALEAIAKQRPDLILMDIQLPIIDGYTATRKIKADPALRSIPIIAVTSYALSGEEKKAREAGCEDYVPKPFSPRQLLAKIRQYLC